MNNSGLSIHQSQNSGEKQQAVFEYKVTTKNLNLAEGDLLVENLTVSNLLTTKTGRILGLEPAGKLTVKNILVKTALAEGNTEKDSGSFSIELHRNVKLDGNDNLGNPSFENVVEITSMGNVTISGSVTKDTQVRYPISFKKINQWQTNQSWERCAVNFDIEKLATVNSATANNFTVWTGDETVDTEVITRKQGTQLWVARRNVEVRLLGTDMSNSYVSLEDAIINIPKEFKDEKGKNINGTYEFIFKGESELTKAQTLPSCVKEAVFTTSQNDKGEYKIFSLNLKTFRLTTAGNLILRGGLEIRGESFGKTTAKLVATKGITVETKPLEGEKNNQTGTIEYHPTKGTLTVDISKGDFNLKANEEAVTVSANGVVTAKNVKVEGLGKVVIPNLAVKSGEVTLINSNTEIPLLTMTAAKLYIGESTNVNVDNLQIKSAYGMESFGDYTVEVDGKLYVNTMKQTAGTFQVGTNASATVITMESVKDIILESGAEFVCDTVTQVSGSKAYLGDKSVFYIKEKGTLETLVIGGKEDQEGTMYLGVGAVKDDLGDFALTINKAPTKNGENLVLKFFVTGEYTTAFKTALQNEFKGNYSSERIKLQALTVEPPIFKVAAAVKAFPLEYIEVLQPDSASRLCNIEQDKTEIKVVEKYITLYSYYADETVEKKELKSFTRWTDAMNYLTSHGNTGTTYLVKITKEEVPVGGKIVLPKTVGKLIVEGVPQATYLDFTGDISLTSNTEFRNIKFTRDVNNTVVHGIAASGKELVLNNVTGTLKSLTGTKACNVVIKNSKQITVTNNVQTIGSIKLENSTLKVTGNKKFTITNVSMENSGLWVEGNATITDLTTIGRGNRIAAANLAINGKVLSNNSEDIAVKYVDKDKSGNTVTPYYLLDASGEEAYTVKENAIFLTKITTKGGVVQVVQPDAATVMVTAPKVAASWFVINHTEDSDFGQIRVDEDTHKLKAYKLTEKKGKNIFPKVNVTDSVLLERYVGDKDPISDLDKTKFVTLDGFGTLQLALDEIAAIGDAAGRYIITLKVDSGEPTQDFKFTEKKAAEIIIRAAEDEIKDKEGYTAGKVDLIYKKDLDFKTNVRFQNVILNPANDGSFKINKYEVTLQDTSFAKDVNEITKKITVSDSNAAAKLVLNNTTQTNITFDSIKQSGSMELSKTNVVVSKDLKLGILKLASSEIEVSGNITLNKLETDSERGVLRGFGVINIKDISLGVLQTIIETVALPTWGTVIEGDKTVDRITSLKNQLTITGKLVTKSTVSLLEIKLLSKDKDGYLITADENHTTAMEALKASCAPALLDSGLVIAKVANINQSDISLIDKPDSDSIVKKNGELLLKNTVSYVSLEYQVETNGAGAMTVGSSFETFADVKKEIDTLKVKRDYTITFHTPGIQEGQIIIPKDVVMNLTMPSAANVKSLILKGTAYYTGSITFNSNVVLAGMNFVQVVNTEEGYKPVDNVIQPDGRTYPAIVKVNTKGYSLSFEYNTASTFNTPIDLNGGNKGVLDFTGTGTLVAGGNWGSFSSDSYSNVIQGSVKGFALVRAENQNIQILGYPVYDAKKAEEDGYKGDYKSTALQVTTLNINGMAEVLVGYNSTNTNSKVERKDNAIIKELNIAEGKLKVMGEGTFTNVALANGGYSSSPRLEVLGQKFTITGNLTNTSWNAEISTTYDASYSPILTVTGNVILEDKDINRISIKVVDGIGEIIKLGGVAEKDKDGKTLANYTMRLLSATKADARYFKPYSECLEDTTLGEYGGGNAPGYILRKVGNYVEVLVIKEGSFAEAKAALYIIEEGKDDALVNYYAYVNDAVANIESLKNKTAEYKIVLLQDAGDENSYQEVRMPKTASKVTFITENADLGNIKNIFFNKDITLGCDTEFVNLTLNSVLDKNGKYANSLKAGKFGLTLNGTKVIVKEIASTGVINLDNGSEVTVDGKASLQDVEVFGSADNKLIYAPAIANNITIKGTIHRNLNSEGGKAKPLYLDIIGTIEGPIAPGAANAKWTLTKVANIEKATFDSFVVKDDSSENPDEFMDVAWDSKALYQITDEYTNEVEVVDTVIEAEKENPENRVVCLDLTEAAEYIKNVGNLQKSFTITMPNNISDTCVTDGNGPSKLTLPAKDKAKEIVLDGQGRSLNFTDNIVTYGDVTIKNVMLDNKIKNFDIANNKNSKGDNPAALTLIDVSFASSEIANIKGTAKTTKLTIEGTQECSEFIISGSITNIAEFKLKNANVYAKSEKLKSNVNKFVVESNGIWETYGPTTIGEIELCDLATGTDEIHTYIATSRASYTAKPTLTVTGTVIGKINGNVTAGKAIPIKVYDIGGRRYLDEGANEAEYRYSNQKLLAAKTEAAEKFIAVPFVKVTTDVEDVNKIVSVDNHADGYEFKEGNIQSYKDTSNFVMNGDTSAMEVVLTNDKTGFNTYVSTYAEAISLINSIGDELAKYTVTLKAIDDNPATDKIVEGNEESISIQDEDGNVIESKEFYVIKTGGKNGEKTLGKLQLPNANKVAQLTIRGEDGENISLWYTGAVAPKCNIIFENIHLSEGTAKNVKKQNGTRQEFTNSGLITLNLGNASVTFGNKVTGGHELVTTRKGVLPTYYNEYECDVAVKSISGSKGTLILTQGRDVYVQGTATIPYLDLQGNESSEYGLYTCGKVSITEISGKGQLNLAACHGTDIWKKGKTQIQIKGEVEPEVMMDITPYIMTDKKTKSYAKITVEQIAEMLITGSTTPQAYQQVAVAPKLASAKAGEITKITLAGTIYLNAVPQFGEEITAVKYNGGLYFTKEGYVISVRGDVRIPLDGGGYRTETHYEGQFLSWEQMVKEVDKINRKDYNYTVYVEKDLGVDKPLSSIPTPSKASSVFVYGTGDGQGIFTTAKNITLKCPIKFQKICINGVQQKGGKYYEKELSLNIGNYNFDASSLLLEYSYESIGNYRSILKITGGKKARLTLQSAELQMKSITAISGIGDVSITSTSGAQKYIIPGGIIGINKLSIWGQIEIDCGTKEFSLQNIDLRMSHATCIKAKNIKITGSSIFANTTLKAGTSALGDGKIILGDIHVVRAYGANSSGEPVQLPYENNFWGKVDKNGRSQIEIKGRVTKDARDNDYGINIGLYHNNSSIKYVQLSEGMQLLKVTKASVSPFKPYYDNRDDKRMGPVLPEYGLYKKGNDIIYGRVKTGESIIPEAKVWFGTTNVGISPAQSQYIEYMTLEEALKAIDTMNNTIVLDNSGKKTYESYTIELLKDVEIGNEKQNGSYKSISMPSKATDLTIWGGEDGHSISFTGNTSLKCNTRLSNVILMPKKKVKNDIVAGKANFAVGNYALTIDQSICGENSVTGVGNTTGSSKSGKLILMPGSTWEANNITGLNTIEFSGSSNTESSVIATGNLTVKNIAYKSKGKVDVEGNLTTDTVQLNRGVEAKIYHNADKTMKVNGTTITNLDETKTTGSVFFEGEGNYNNVNVYLKSAGGKDIMEGTQIISGKYLDASHWIFNIGGGENDNHNAYLKNNNLYVGSGTNN